MGSVKLKHILNGKIEYSSKNNNHTKEKYSQRKESYVDAYIRKLPVGQSISETARNLAIKYNLSIRDGYTIVSPYIKNKKDKPL